MRRLERRPRVDDDPRGWGRPPGLRDPWVLWAEDREWWAERRERELEHAPAHIQQFHGRVG